MRSNGNLGKAEIEKFFPAHDINLTGSEIDSCFSRVKEVRNQLSYGRSTFDEVGKNLNMVDLESYKSKIVKGLEQLIEAMSVQLTCFSSDTNT